VTVEQDFETTFDQSNSSNDIGNNRPAILTRRIFESGGQAPGLAQGIAQRIWLCSAQRQRSTAMIVGEANSLVSAAHDRMPVMLMSEDYDRWLGPKTGIDDLKAMLKPYDSALMEVYAVNRAVDSVKNNTEKCIEPAAD
jgi:putative SOS response-associated peptidase YedK